MRPSLYRNIFCSLLMSLSAYASSQTVSGTTSITLRESKPLNEVTADIHSKEVSKEIGIANEGNITIENTTQNVVVKTWDQPKVKLSVTLHYTGESKLTDEEWLDNLNLSLKKFGSAIKFKTNGNVNTSYTANGSGNINYTKGLVSVFDGNGQVVAMKGNIKRMITITVPAGSRLDIESKYANITLPTHLGDVKVDIVNGNLDTEDLGTLILRSKYSNIYTGDIKTAEIELSNSRLISKNIQELDIDTRASNVEIVTVKKVNIISSNDDYEFEEAGEVLGKKDFGSLRITKLNNKLDLTGGNADIKIKSLATEVSLVKITDRFANIRIPLNKLKNYSVNFSGIYTSVYPNFEKLPNTSIVSIGSLSNLTAVNKVKPAVQSITITDTAANRIVTGNLTSPAQITTAGMGSNLTVTGIISASTIAGTLSNPTVNAFHGFLSTGASESTISKGRTYEFVPTNIVTLGSDNLGAPFVSNETPSNFRATVGDGKGLKIDIKCQNCRVDFK